MNPTFILGFLLLVFLLLAPITPSFAFRSEPDPDPDLLTTVIPRSKAGGSGIGNSGLDGFDKGWPSIGGPGVVGGPGGYPIGWFIIRTVVCMDEGPCYKKKLTCPAKCFTSYSRSGKGFGASGASGGCTIDCNKNCTAYC